MTEPTTEAGKRALRAVFALTDAVATIAVLDLPHDIRPKTPEDVKREFTKIIAAIEDEAREQGVDLMTIDHANEIAREAVAAERARIAEAVRDARRCRNAELHDVGAVWDAVLAIVEGTWDDPSDQAGA